MVHQATTEIGQVVTNLGRETKERDWRAIECYLGELFTA